MRIGLITGPWRSLRFVVIGAARIALGGKSEVKTLSIRMDDETYRGRIMLAIERYKSGVASLGGRGTGWRTCRLANLRKVW
jgi:hypothetical protein